MRSKEHTEVGVALERIKKAAPFLCILFSSGKTNTSFVLKAVEGSSREVVVAAEEIVVEIRIFPCHNKIQKIKLDLELVDFREVSFSKLFKSVF